MGERGVRNAEVGSSILLRSTTFLSTKVAVRPIRFRATPTCLLRVATQGYPGLATRQRVSGEWVTRGYPGNVRRRRYPCQPTTLSTH